MANILEQIQTMAESDADLSRMIDEYKEIETDYKETLEALGLNTINQVQFGLAGNTQLSFSAQPSHISIR